MSIIKGKKYRYGIHIPDRKSLTSEKQIETINTPNSVFISLSQHIGAPATPIVNVGDKVKKGTLIAKESGAVSANVYSSISGTVEDILEIVNGMGAKQTYIKIANNGLNEEQLLDKLEDFSPASLVNRIREAGIVGLGGAGFPTAVKLSPKTQLDTLIINGAECEPYLNCDYRLMLERAEDIYKGIKYTAKALNITNVIIGIEANKPKAIEIFSKFNDIDVVLLKKQYPMGSEKHLVYCTTGRKVPCGKMPFDVGCCVQNIKTVIAIYEAVELNKPLTNIVMTVSGLAVNEQKNLFVSIGTPLEDIISFCGGLKEQPAKIISGGPMMGRALINLNYYTVKTTSGLLLLANSETNTDMPTNCINCSKCAKNCPMRLMPMYIETYALCGDFKNAEKYGAMNCIECGSCAFNCPAKRPIVQNIQYAKAKIKEMKAKC